MEQIQRVVIVGGGFAGLEAAKCFAATRVEVILIDRENVHCFQPLLYQVATATLSPADIAWPIRAVLRFQENATVLMAEVTAIDRSTRHVQAGDLRIAYDYLILATGVTHSYFGRDDWSRIAPGLKRIDDATRIRHNVLSAFERAELAEDATEQIALLTFVIVGGGATGVELAGAIAEIAHHTLTGNFRRIDPRSAKIILVEAGARVLSTFPTALSRYSQDALEKMGVRILLGTQVTEMDEGGVETTAGRVEARTVLWAAGVIASPAAQWLGAASDRSGRVIVTGNLHLPDDCNIFVVGDTVAAITAAGDPVPGIAPAAKQMGRYAANAIKARIEGRPVQPFAYHHRGDLATVGRKAAVVRMGSIQFTGFLGWIVWSIAHVYFLIGLRNRFVVAVSWAWTYLTKQRSARIVFRTSRPRAESENAQ